MIARLTLCSCWWTCCCCCCYDCADVWRCVYIICVRIREWEHVVTRNANKANQRESRSKNAVKATTAALEMESTGWQNQNILPRQISSCGRGVVESMAKKEDRVCGSPDARRGKTAPRVIRVQSLEFQREQATLNGISTIKVKKKKNQQSPAVDDGTEAKKQQ